MRRWWSWLHVDAREKLADAYEIGRREVDGVILAVGFPLPARDDERPVDGRAAELGGVAPAGRRLLEESLLVDDHGQTVADPDELDRATDPFLPGFEPVENLAALGGAVEGEKDDFGHAATLPMMVGVGMGASRRRG